jgi:hypothetical protein
MILRHITFLVLGIISIVTIPFSLVGAEEAQKPFISFVKHETFGLPVACDLGDSCHIMKYVDMGPDEGKLTDPYCNALTTDAHKGTDFVISDEKTMKEGVSVLAALDGTISKIRDGESDRWPTEEDIKTIKEQRKECGNAILIDHGNQLQTVYCHLKNGSIKVKQGQKVQKGDKLADIGLSGLTELPHLHFGIIKDQKVIDPFTGKDNQNKCGQKPFSLWDKDLDISYQPIAIQSVGFSTTIPSLEKLSIDSYYPKTISPTNDVLSFYVIFFGAQKGDQINLVIRDPNDKIFSEYNIIQDKTRTRQFYFTGKRLKGKPLTLGAYTGYAKITRVQENEDKEVWEDYSAILVE